MAAAKMTKAEAETAVVRILSEARAVPRFRAARERNALIDAIEYGEIALAHALLANGVDPNSARPNGKSALWYAAHWGRNTLIKDLVVRGATLPDDVLMGPVHDGDAETVKLLIERGANVNCVASFTRYSNHFPPKEILLASAISSTAKHMALEEIRVKHAKCTESDMSQEGTPESAMPDYESIPLMLIAAGANVNQLAFTYSIHDGFIRTILGLAAFSGLAKTVEAMLAAGADVNQKDTWGGTALLDAIIKGHQQIARFLLRKGANPHITYRDGSTPVSVAEAQGFIELAAALRRA